MPPKSIPERNSASTHKCRRSRRIAYRIKSMAKGQSVSFKGLPSPKKEIGKPSYSKKSVAKIQPVPSEKQPSSMKEDEKPLSMKRVKKPLYSKKFVVKTQLASTKRGRPSSTKESGKPSNGKKSVTNSQLASSNKRQSTSTKKYPAKRRRVMKTDEINEGSLRVGQHEQEDFSIYIEKILEELSPELTISEEAIADMNIYLNHVFNLLSMTSAIYLIGRSGASMTDKEIEHAVIKVVEGDLAKYCVAEGRRAIKKIE